MDNIDILTSIGQLGLNGVLLVVLFALWKEFREQNAFIRDLLLDAAAERKVLAEATGISTQDLKLQAQIVRKQLKDNLHHDSAN